jgi:histidine triad (HIT) family protein
MMKNCIFCKIVDKVVPAQIISETDAVLAFCDVHPIAPVHILIIPKEHIESMNDIADDHTDVIAEMFFTAKKIAVEKGIAHDGYKLLIRTGVHGGQEVSHIHLHLIGGAQLSEDIHPVMT